jgi:hypothetical protein
MRGELLSGWFLNHFVTFLNHHIRIIGMLDELIYHLLVQWVLEEDVVGNMVAMRNNDIYGIGKIGGLFTLRTQSNTNLGSIWFTRSHIINDRERSERGLLDMDYESFMFVHTIRYEYNNDISDWASDNRRMTVRDPYANFIGYVAEGTDVFTPEGELIPGNILSAPPSDGSAYIEFYGLKYLWYEEFFDLELPLSIDVYKKLFEVLQIIRRNGPNIDSFAILTSIMGEGYITNVDIQQEAYYYNVYYDLDDSVTVWNRERRYVAWKEAVKMKFKYYNLFDRAKLEDI